MKSLLLFISLTICAISLSNVTQNTTGSTIADIVNSGEFLCEVQGINEGDTDVFRFYVQEVPWPPTSYSYGSNFTICSSTTYGCTSETATNYDPAATIDDGYCIESTEASQTIVLTEGWSIISTYINPENSNFTAFVSPVVQHIIIAKDYAGNAYLPDWDFNGIPNLTIGQAYQIKMAINDVLLVTGAQIQPEENPLTLIEGSTLLAYLRTEPASAGLVLADLVDQDMLVIAKDYAGNAFFPEWGFNRIGDLEAGKGYQVKVSQQCTLEYIANGAVY